PPHFLANLNKLDGFDLFPRAGPGFTGDRNPAPAGVVDISAINAPDLEDGIQSLLDTFQLALAQRSLHRYAHGPGDQLDLFLQPAFHGVLYRLISQPYHQNAQHRQRHDDQQQQLQTQAPEWLQYGHMRHYDTSNWRAHNPPELQVIDFIGPHIWHGTCTYGIANTNIVIF